MPFLMLGLPMPATVSNAELEELKPMYPELINEWRNDSGLITYVVYLKDLLGRVSTVLTSEER
jgi:hypothetical protein